MGYEHLNIKVGIGYLLFDLLLDSVLEPVSVDKRLDKHNHFAFELHYFISGSGTMIVEHQSFQIEPCSVHLIGPGVYHQIQDNPSSPTTRFNTQFMFSHAKVEDRYSSRIESDEIFQVLSDIRYVQFNDDGGISRFFESIRSELEIPSPGRYTYIQSLFTQMLVRLVRSIRPNTETRNELPNKPVDDLRTRIIDIYFNGYKHHITLDGLASQLNLSVKQTNRILKKYYNTTFKQKLLDTRIEVAKDLLRHKNWSIQRIGEEVGYSTLKSFYEAFVNRTGVSPSRYRKT